MDLLLLKIQLLNCVCRILFHADKQKKDEANMNYKEEPLNITKGSKNKITQCLT